MLEELRKELAKLNKRAAKKLAEVTDGMDAAAVRAIEDEHEAILGEIEAKRAEIEELERQSNEGGEGGEGGENNGSPADAARAADILQIGTRAGMDTADIEHAIRDGVTVDDFRTRAFDHLAERSRQAPTRPSRIVRDEAETRRIGMTAAMTRALGGAEPEGDRLDMARGFMEFRDLVEFAAEFIGHRGLPRSVREREDVLSRAFHTASDFPALFSDAINTMLDGRYALATPTYRRISMRGDFQDFRPHYTVSLGEFPMLQKLTDTGEIKFGTFGENKEQIAVVPYGRGIRLSRQMLVNDRLNGIGQILGGYGRTVSRFEEITFYAMMLSANTKLADAKVVFHADHANLAGAGTAITDTALGAGRAAMRKQKGLDEATLNIAPSILLVSPDKETEARKAVTAIVAAETANVNQFSFLEPLVAGELTGNGWYLFADPADAPVYRWGLLDGYTAPRIRMDEPFGQQGLAMTVEHDFGVGAIDFRGGYKNPGN